MPPRHVASQPAARQAIARPAHLQAAAKDAAAAAAAAEAGGLDAGALDTGGLDAGALDAGGLDAGALDTGGLDAAAAGDGARCDGAAGAARPGDEGGLAGYLRCFGRRHWLVAGLLAGVLAALAVAGAALGRTPGWLMLACGPLAMLGALLAVGDALTHRLPNALQLPAIGASLALLAAAALLEAEPGRIAVAAAFSGGLFAAAAAAALLWPASLGFGDVKLIALLALPAGWCGPGTVAAWLMLAFVAAGAGAVILILARRATRRTQLAMAPYLVGGLFAALPLT